MHVLRCGCAVQLVEKRAREEAEESEKAGKVELREALKPKINAWAAGKKVCRPQWGPAFGWDAQELKGQLCFLCGDMPWGQFPALWLLPPGVPALLLATHQASQIKGAAAAPAFTLELAKSTALRLELLHLADRGLPPALPPHRTTSARC
jgi:hypothetical protein